MKQYNINSFSSAEEEKTRSLQPGEVAYGRPSIGGHTEPPILSSLYVSSKIEGIVKDKGWYVPAIHGRVADTFFDRLKKICERLIKRDFHIDAEVLDVRFLKRMELDKFLHLHPVKIFFSSREEFGEAFTFIDDKLLYG